jgi:hypothetical protein
LVIDLSNQVMFTCIFSLRALPGLRPAAGSPGYNKDCIEDFLGSPDHRGFLTGRRGRRERENPFSLQAKFKHCNFPGFPKIQY